MSIHWPQEFDDVVRAALVKEVVDVTSERDAWRECARKAVRLVEKVINEQSFYGATARQISDLFDVFDGLVDGEGVGNAARQKINRVER